MQKKGNLEFILNYSRFYPSDSIGYVEIAYALNVRSLKKEKKGSVLKLPLEIEISVKGNSLKKELYDKWKKEFILEESFSQLVDLTGILLPPGDYSVSFKLKTMKKQGEISFPLHIEKVGKNFLSDIELTHSFSPDTEKFPFKRANFSFIPNPSLTFSFSDSFLYYYLEIYNPLSEFYLEYLLIYEQTGDTIISEEKLQKTNETRVFTYGKIPIYALRAGNYVLNATLKDSTKQKIRSAEKKFTYLSQSELQKIQAQKEYLKYMEFIDYYASKEEIEQLDKIKEDEAKYLFLQKFWKKFDTDPETPVNEFLVIFINRVQYADLNYSTQYRKGRRTDRGRIYIKFGPPFEVKRGYYPVGKNAWESWLYQTPRKMQFIFVDILGVGLYELMYSSEPSEPGRADWKKFVPTEEIEVFP